MGIHREQERPVREFCEHEDARESGLAIAMPGIYLRGMRGSSWATRWQNGGQPNAIAPAQTGFSLPIFGKRINIPSIHAQFVAV